MIFTRIRRSISMRLSFGFGAILLLLVALAVLGQYSSRSVAAKMAAVPQKAASPSAEVPVTPAQPLGEMEQIVTAALEEGAPPPEEEGDISDWDLDAELAGMTDQEKNAFLNKLHQRKKDGSCVEGFSFCSWG